MSNESPNPPAPDYGTAPPPPLKETSLSEELREPAQMGAVSRLVNIFFDPGEVFRDIRRSPRDWYLPIIVLLVVGVGIGYVVQSRLNLTTERLAVAAIDQQLASQGKTRKDIPEAQLEQQQNITEFFIKFTPVFAVVVSTIFFFLAAGIYRLLFLLFGARTTFFRVLSVVAYAFYAPNIVKAILQLILSFVMDPDTVDPTTYMARQGLISASPAAFFSPTEQKFLFTFLSYFDVFSIWFLVLSAIGFSLICAKKLKMGTAVMIAFIPYILVMAIASLWAMVTG